MRIVCVICQICVPQFFVKDDDIECSMYVQAAYSVIWPEDPVLELSQEVVKLKMEIAHIDANLLKVIGDSDVKDIILFGAGKIKNLVEINQQV